MGRLFKVPAFFVWFVGGLWSFVICINIVREVIGFWGLVLGFMFFPATIYLAPWYAGFFRHNWFPVFLTYGTGLTAAILFGIGTWLDERKA